MDFGVTELLHALAEYLKKSREIGTATKVCPRHELNENLFALFYIDLIIISVLRDNYICSDDKTVLPHSLESQRQGDPNTRLHTPPDIHAVAL